MRQTELQCVVVNSKAYRIRRLPAFAVAFLVAFMIVNVIEEGVEETENNGPCSSIVKNAYKDSDCMHSTQAVNAN